MRIVFNTSYVEGIRSVNRAAEALAEAQRKVGSGQRMARPSDDPLGSVAAINEHASLSRLGAYSSAADAAAYRLGMADSALSDIITQLTAAQSTALAARGSSQTQAQRDAASDELISIRDALMSDINTKFQGSYLFSGSDVSKPAYQAVGAGISAYQGDADPAGIEVEPGRSVASTFDGGKIFQGADAKHVLDALTDLSAAVRANNEPAIANGVAALSRAFDRATSAQAEVGNDLRAIDDVHLRNASAKTGVVARLATIEDADLAQAAAQLSQSETAYRAALSAVSTLGRVSLMDYLK
jgi:flagellar hook-associated protein 3 FlgL